MIKFVKSVLRSNNFARGTKEALLGLRNLNSSASRRFAYLCKQDDVRVVFDVGANVGQFAKDMRRHGFTGDIYSFEPDPFLFSKLVKNFKADQRWHGINSGLANMEGKVELNLSGNSGLSNSFLGMKKVHLENFPGSRYVGKVEVLVTRLAKKIEELDLEPSKLAVKIDVQGFEMEVLHGTDPLLKDVAYLLIEASIIPLYESEPKLIELLTLLESKNHQIIDIFRGINSQDGNLLQVDIITTSRAKSID